ncbi:MAG TPA: DUF1579 domain-containing protein [Phycisphaerales bacterium]|nr:DUF1579 domain-containing protein [Phycisphaerales bacterium]
MKCTLCPAALIGLSLLAGGSLIALAQPEKSGAPAKGQPEKAQPDHQMQPDMAKMMAAMEAASTPGANHKLLEQWIGTWDTTMKIMMPGAPAMESKGRAEVSWLFEGRWLQERVDGDMMGQPMKGLSIIGYDNFNKCFVSSWVDNHSTAMITSTGSLDQTGKVLTMFGRMDEPMTGEHNKTVRFQTTFVDKDTRKFTIDEVQYGQPFTVVEITYKRAK